MLPPKLFLWIFILIMNAAAIWDRLNLLVPRLKAIICTAEILFPFQKDYIHKVFKCPVVMEYGCSEVDIIAFQCMYEKYHICSENVLFSNIATKR